MRTYNQILFHCLHCGRVVHLTSVASVPNCCGELMINAASETIRENDRENYHPNVEQEIDETTFPKSRKFALR